MKLTRVRWLGAALVAGVFLALAHGSASSADEPTHIEFPAGFRWCVSTSAHQIEGDNIHSDWWQWEHVPGHIKNGDVSGRADDSWNRVDQDVAMMKSLHLTDYRFSVEWAKIEPEEGRYDWSAVDHYRKEVLALRAAGIQPIITLHHFTFPQWVRDKGGWEWDGIADAFASYTGLVYHEIGPEVRDWITVNEPMVNVGGGYYTGQVPPGLKRGLDGLVPVLVGLLKAHAAAYHVLHSLADSSGQQVRVGMAHHLRTMDAGQFWNPIDQIAAAMADGFWNWALPDALESGRLQVDMFWLLSVDEEIPGLAGTQDFIGVNYYTGDLVHVSFGDGLQLWHRDDLPKNDLGWDIYPEGFYRILTAVGDRYDGKPVLITENGIADATDQKRPAFIRDHLEQVARAIDDGVPIEGYCHWSLMDNFEWNEGFAPRFGLFDVDYQTFERHPRESAILFSQIARDNGFTKP